MKNLLLCCEAVKMEKSYLYKDVGLVPLYLSKEYALKAKIIYFNSKKKLEKSNFNGIELVKLKKLKVVERNSKYDKFGVITNINFARYIIKHSKEINFLMFFHFNLEKLILIFLYKLFNKNGKIYSKLDITIHSVRFYNQDFTNIFRKIQIFFLKNILKRFDLISCETKECFNEIFNNGLCGLNISDKLIYVPNGFDEDYLIKNNIKVKKFEEKENIMITVGRIGTVEKNNEMLLEAIEKVDLKEWKVYIIGPYTENFKKNYDDFVKNNLDKKRKVILVGNVEDKNLLYDYYNRAKVFLFTSKWESFGIVLIEALRFGNYIITTNVGGAKDITNNGKIGVITDIGVSEQYKNEVLKVVNKEINLKEKYLLSIKWSEENFIWSKILKDERIKNFFEKN